ncbi:histidine phosphatase family protein [Caulobacter sp. SLTY]|uniref:histidine phosphatase family protein n=1 Tax=Caulobacter sp. SLTY TaxID=2683262 RepID=UPI0014131B98|nr:histidine phosphatase family protein [Caulobacter sp. SLTY]NBB16297.1 histidine phosphatase family protein [Caulobacter sp. SLTY]
MPHVHMIRHGKPASTWGDADEDPGLDDAGRAQARAAAEALLALPDGLRPTQVVSSPLRRCRETAAPTAEALGVDLVIDPRVGEIPTPSAETLDTRPGWLRAAFGGLWREIKGDLDYDQWRRSVAAAVAEYPGAAVFSHYVAINAAVSTALEDDRVMGFRPDHTSITRFEIIDGRLMLVEKGAEAATQVL